MLSLEQNRIVEPKGRKGKGGEGNREETEGGVRERRKKA